MRAARLLVAALVTLPVIAAPVVSSAAGAAGAATPRTGTAALAVASALPLVTPRPATDVVDGFGVGVHLAYDDTPYADADRVADLLDDLGVEHVRDDLFPDRPDQVEAIRTVGARGIGFDLIAGSPTSPWPVDDYVAAVGGPLRGVVDSVEGANEWDIFHAFDPGASSDWAADLRAHQQALHAAIQADPRTADVPVLAPSLAFEQHYDELLAGGDLAEVSDVANAHVYPGGVDPQGRIAWMTSLARRLGGDDKPLWVTEAGYHNATATTDGHQPTSEAAAAAYLPRMLAEHLAAGVDRVYAYELLDEKVDPDLDDPEAHFGLVRHDLTPKPSYLALQRLLALLDDDSGTAPELEPLGLRVTGPDDVRQLLFRSGDGTYALLLWRNVTVWNPDPAVRSSVAVPTADVAVDLDRRATATVSTVGARLGEAAPTTGRRVTVPLGGDLAVVTLERPTGPDSAPDPAPTATITATTPASAPAATPTPAATPAAPVVTAAPTAPAAPAAPAAPSGRVGAAPGAPARPAATRLRSGATKVTWAPAPGRGHRVQQYAVVAGQRRVLVAGGRHAVVLPRAARAREVKLAARNALGWGAWTTVTVTRGRR